MARPHNSLVTRILIADDSPPVRKALAQLLVGAHACEVVEVEDGQAAVLRALALRPNLVIVDLAMPVMDGLTAAREISKLLPEVPILMYTMHWTPALDLAAQKSGVRKLVPKVHSTELLAAVGELLEGLQHATSPATSIPALPVEVPPPPPDSAIIAAAEKTSAPVLPDPNPKKLAS